jgi:subtilisin family serine protease
LIRRLTCFLALFALAGVALASAASARTADPNRYIVVLKSSAGSSSDVARDHARRYGVRQTHVYSAALKGYAAEISPSQLGAVRSDSRVAYVEQDQLVRVNTTQTSATWGIDRIDQRDRPLSGTFTYTNTGSGVSAYIIDTGLRASHSQFGGRAVSNQDFVEPAYNTGGVDCNGHGTHVGGTVGGSIDGVAKGVSLVGVRVLDCGGYGYISEIVAGVNWVTANASEPAVANMSLGGGASSALDTAVSNSIASGVNYAIAAGNGNAGGRAQDACKYSPARVSTAMTVSATTNTDSKPSWANYGNCVDWFAPGVSITSAWYSSDTATNTISGTSMATPHTAGVAALYLQSDPSATPSTVRNALFNKATPNKVSSSKTANNRLLFTDW